MQTRRRPTHWRLRFVVKERSEVCTPQGTAPCAVSRHLAPCPVHISEPLAPRVISLCLAPCAVHNSHQPVPSTIPHRPVPSTISHRRSGALRGPANPGALRGPSTTRRLMRGPSLSGSAPCAVPPLPGRRSPTAALRAVARRR
eukprot:3567834-Pleurochrysis_carterae.AAC.1